ncbi:MAG TPA: response regulator [Gammaproteobacteria bacterium]|nr:response regulator [Gammaproteobacteria bacterium]
MSDIHRILEHAVTQSEPEVVVDSESPADILVVDDNKSNLVAIEAALGELGRRLVKVQSGQEALRQLLTRDFALIILDVQMPGMDGFETARLIRRRERNRYVPIIFITAYNSNDEEILQGYRLGASDFLFKPIVPEILTAKAKVFVDLQQRTTEVKQQAHRLRELERLEMERRISLEREHWESEVLRQENRNKDEFLAVLAHELRNPLSPLVTGLDLIRTYNIQHDGLNQIREIMERQVSHLIRLIDDLLDMARISSGKINLQIGCVNVEEVVKQAIASVESLINHNGHTLTVNPPEQAVLVAADTVRLTQVIANLLNNAARYTSNGGRIELTWARDGAEALIRVADNGKGISANMLDRIFDRFVQEENHGFSRGLGLGLTLVRHLVTMHGGLVRAFSEGVGKGSEFVVRLPLAEGNAEADGQPKLIAVPDGPPLNIILIEDEADIRVSVKALLESWGHKVRTAVNGEHGMKLIFQYKPDVAIVDIAMPGLDGYSVARHVRARSEHKNTRLVAMTGFGRDQDRQRSFQAGFDNHITKPARPEDLKWALRSKQK